MSEIKLNAEALEEAGAALGFAVAALIRGFQAGMDAYEMMAEEAAIHEIRKAEEERECSVKTEIGDCRKCWCDQCANLETCVHIREGELPDGIRPFPCIGCENGMRFKPCEETKCEDFVQGEGLNNG